MADQLTTELNDEDVEALHAIERKLVHPEIGLPKPLFDFALSITPMINTDLVVLDDDGRALWAWRDDAFGRGWHIPGSIIRVNETIEARIDATAATELRAAVVAEPAPRAIVELFGVRGAFISMSYRCRLRDRSEVRTVGASSPGVGDLRWFDGMPHDVYPAHPYYEKVLPIIRARAPGTPLMLTVHLKD